MTLALARKRPLVTLLAAAVVVVSVGVANRLISGPATVRTPATVDFGKVAGATDSYAIGLGSSTYGATPLNSPAQAAAERGLDARMIRIPVGVRNGVATSSAA
ncbi:MAG: hypothetical protein V7647_3264, partial [Acidobacteriota bacterium]